MGRYRWPVFVVCGAAAGLPSLALAFLTDFVSKTPVGPPFWLTWAAVGTAVGVTVALVLCSATRSEGVQFGAGVMLSVIGALLVAAYGADTINEWAERWAGVRQ